MHSKIKAEWRCALELRFRWRQNCYIQNVRYPQAEVESDQRAINLSQSDKFIVPR